mgnify:CR=1 FL=1
MFGQPFVMNVKECPQGRIDVAATSNGRFFDVLAPLERIAMVRR